MQWQWLHSKIGQDKQWWWAILIKIGLMYLLKSSYVHPCTVKLGDKELFGQPKIVP